MSNRAIFNLQYDIPLYNISYPGRQNRSGNGFMRITPGMTEPMEFVFGNVDGVVINLANFEIRFLVWNHKRNDLNSLEVSLSDLILNKKMDSVEPSSGRAVLLLTGDDTIRLSAEGQNTLRWSVVLINTDDQVFPMQITQSGNRFGSLHLDLQSDFPLPELIKNPK